MENESFLEEFKKYVANPKSRVVIFLGVAVFSVISIALVFFAINNNTASQEIAEAKKIEDNPAQKADILSQIVKNNPKTSLNTKPTTQPSGSQSTTTQDKFSGNSGYTVIDPTTGLPVGTGENLVAVGPNEQPDLSKYNYRKTTETVIPGSISDVCGLAFSYQSAGRYISSEFFDNDNSYYVRNNEYADGSLKGFYNSHYGKDINETYNFASGDYAIKQKYKSYWYDQQVNGVLSYAVPNSNILPTSGPVSFAVINSIISNYYGGNAVVQRVYQQANRTFYEIKTSRQYSCGENTNSAVVPYIDANGLVTIVTVNTVDAQSFEITNSKTYLNTVSAETLIYSRDYKVEYKLTNFDTVSSEFNNINSSDVRTIDWTNYKFDKVEYATRISNYLKSSNSELILPIDDAYISDIYSKNTPSVKENGDYYKDRKFYVAGSNGDATYAEIMKRYGPNVPFLNYGLTTANQYSTYRFTQYEPGANYDSLLKSFESYGPFGTTEFTRPIHLGGEMVDVKIRQYVYYSNYYGYDSYYPSSYPISYVMGLADRYPTISALSYPASFPNATYAYVRYEVLFKYHNSTYIGSLSGWAIDRFLSEAFENVVPSTDAGSYRLSLAVYGGVYGDGWYGYGEGYGYGFPY